MKPQGALPDFLAALRSQSEGAIRTDDFSRILYSTDASIYQVMPHGVFLPRTSDDVHAAVALAAQYGIRIVPRGGGSSLAGQAVGEALVIDFTAYLDNILDFSKEEQWVRVQPGIVLDRLNSTLATEGLLFGPDPASSNRAAMGGIVSNNSTGSHSICYGMTADHVMEMNAVLSDGSRVNFGPVEAEHLDRFQQKSGLEGKLYRALRRLTTSEANRAAILEGTPRHWRRCGGYNLDRFIGAGPSFHWKPHDERFNLARMVCGAEGTLAVIQDVTLNLVPSPEAQGLGVVHFGSLDEALSAVPVILEVNPSAVELLDNLGITLCRGVPDYARLLDGFIEGDPDCILITEFYGNSKAEVGDKIDKLQSHLNHHSSGTVVKVLDPARQQDVWKVRKVGLGLLMSIKGDHKPIPFIEDAAVPTQHLAEYVRKIDAFCSALNTRVAYYAHASAGCVHIRPLINAKAATEIAKIPEITAFAVELLHGYGGSLSSEHGDGRVRSWMNERFFGPALYGLYREVKGLFDPENILNPGNVVDGPSPTSDLRYGEEYQALQLSTTLDWESDQGFDRAVEMCNGAGICRKEDAGAMCPSFMVTREEEHSTRGRANLLRAALSGTLPHSALTSERMYEAMDLCVECKACKAECPSSVDMAKIKFEFLAQYHQKNGTPFRSRLFGDAARLGRMGSGFHAGLANAVLRSGAARRAMEAMMGLSRHRTLPAFAKEPFTRWFRRKPQSSDGRPQVVLFNDTFTTYHEPEIAISATEVLEAAGFSVVLPGHWCCGRPMISKGLVEQARRAARRTVDSLASYAEQGVPIIGLEPSCLLSIRDEYLYLLPGYEPAHRVAEQSLLFEEFIARLAEQGELSLDLIRAEQSVLLHGHCHQKALAGTASAKRVLSLPQGYRVQEIDSGCCGMAGSFGYEKEHYDISIRMAEHRLLPAIRAEADDTIVVAAGTSCRHQIRDGTGCEPLHPAQVLRNALATAAA